MSRCNFCLKKRKRKERIKKRATIKDIFEPKIKKSKKMGNIVLY